MHKKVHAGLAKKTYKALSGVDDNVPRQGLLMYYKKVNGVFQSIVALSTESYQSVDTSVQSIFFLGATTLRTPSEALDLALDSAYLNAGTMVGSSAGIALYAANTATNTLRRASKALHEDLTIFDDDLAWVMNTDKGTLNTLVGPMHTTSYVGPLVDANGDPAPHNYIPNSHAIGASVGVLPTGWTKTDSNGVIVTVVGAGDGYTDFLVSGTATATSFTSIFFATAITALNGQQWNISNVVSTITQTGTLVSKTLVIRELTSGSAFIKDNSSVLNEGQNTYTTVLSGGTTGLIQGRVTFHAATDSTINLTIRISQPQLSKSATKLTYVPTYGTAVFSPAVHRTTTTGKWLNAIPNSHGVGASAGVLPTGWVTANHNGINVTIAAAGDGWQEFRIAGTASASANPSIYTNATAVIPATVGQVWTGSFVTSLISDVYNNAQSSSSPFVAIIEYSSASAYLAHNSTVLILTSGGEHTRVLNNTSCAYCRTNISFVMLTGVTVDFTIRVSNPQLTDSGSKLPYTKTVGTAVEGNYTSLAATTDSVVANWTKSLLNVVDTNKAVPTTDNATHYIATAIYSFVSGTIYHQSVKIKADGYDWVRLSFNAMSFPVGGRSAYFNVATGVLGTVDPNVSAVISGPDSEGYYLCSISRDATVTMPSIALTIVVVNADYIMSIVGDGVSGVRVKDFLLVSKVNHQYPYITPGTSSNVRTPDVINKGVLTSGAWTQMLQNSIFAGAASGTPGTAPTNWAFGLSTGTTIISGRQLTLSCTTGNRQWLRQTLTVSASTTYYFSFDINIHQTAIAAVFANNAFFPSGATSSTYIDGVLITPSTFVPTVGQHKILIVLAVSTTAGTAEFRFGCGAGQVAPSDLSATFSNPQVSASYQYPYAASGPGQIFTVPATSASTGGNGCNIPMTPGQYEWVTDGVELMPPFVSNGLGYGTNQTPPNSTITFGNGSVTMYSDGASCDLLHLGFVVGERYLLIPSIASKTGTWALYNGGANIPLFDGVSVEFISTSTTVSIKRITAGSIVINSISIQRIVNSVYVPSKGDKMLAALRGNTDGVELWIGGDFTGSIGTNGIYGIPETYSWSSFTGGAMKFTRSAATGWEGVLRQILTSGFRYKISLDVYNVNVSGNLMVGGDITFTNIKPSTTGIWERKEFETTATGNDCAFYSETGTAGQIWYIDNVSIQRLLPSQFTAVTAVWMGASSAKLPAGLTLGHNILDCSNNSTDQGFGGLLSFGASADGGRMFVVSKDGVTTSSIHLYGPTWNRDEIHIKISETNPVDVPNVGDFAGKYFRTGNLRLTTSLIPIAAITWAGWVIYDGSMNPLTHWRLALNGNTPLGIVGAFLSNKSLTQQEIETRLSSCRII